MNEKRIISYPLSNVIRNFSLKHGHQVIKGFTIPSLAPTIDDIQSNEGANLDKGINGIDDFCSIINDSVNFDNTREGKDSMSVTTAVDGRNRIIIENRSEEEFSDHRTEVDLSNGSMLKSDFHRLSLCDILEQVLLKMIKMRMPSLSAKKQQW